MLEDNFISKLICPHCRTALTEKDENLLCRNCKAIYQVKSGIPLLCRDEPETLCRELGNKSYLMYCNLQKVGVFFIPNTSYFVMKEYSKQIPNFIDRIRLKLLKYHPDIQKTINIHHKALLMLDAELEESNTSDFADGFISYYNMYGCKPFVALFKYLEGKLFQALDNNYFGKETLEIGVSDSRTSNLHFHNKQIEFATDYTENRLFSGLHKNRFLFSSNIKHIPLADASMKSIFLVHIFDDLDFDIELALTEINRVLKQGGHLIFSCSNELYTRQQQREKMLRLVNISNNDFVKYQQYRYDCNNILSLPQLKDKLNDTGFEIIDYTEFFDIEYAWLWDIGMTIEMGLGKTRYDLLINDTEREEYFALANRVANKLTVNENKKKDCGAMRGIHYLCIAKKSEPI